MESLFVLWSSVPSVSAALFYLLKASGRATGYDNELFSSLGSFCSTVNMWSSTTTDIIAGRKRVTTSRSCKQKVERKKKKYDIFSLCRNKKQSKMKANTKQQRHFATSEVTYIRTRRGSLKTWLSIISHAPWPSDSIRSSSIRSGLSWLSTQIKMINIQFTFSCVYCSLWCVLKKITHTQSKVIMKKYTPWSNSGCIYKIKG